MKTKIIITKMDGSDVTEKFFLNEKDCRNFFSEWCDERGYEYDADSLDAGGIGHDYRIEIIEY